METASELHGLLHLRWDYGKAVALYERIGRNSIWKLTFSLGENSFNSEKLREELTALEPQYPFTVQRRQRLEEDLPKPVLELEQEWKSLFKEANYLRTEVFRRGHSGELVHPEEKRNELAHQIRDRFDEIERLWGAVDYFRKHGHIPPAFQKSAVEPMTRDAMGDRLRNLRSYISKAKKGKKYKLTLEEMQSEAAELERRLNQ